MTHHIVFTEAQFAAIQRVSKRMAELKATLEQEMKEAAGWPERVTARASHGAGMQVQAEALSAALATGRVVYGLDEVTDDFLTCADIDCRAIFPRDVTEGYDDGWEHTLCPDHARDEAKDREERREEREEVEA